VSRSVAEYVALALISNVRWDPDDDIFKSSYLFDSDFSGDLTELQTYAEKKCGFPLNDQITSQAVRILAKCGLLRVTDDNYSGTFVKIKASEFSSFIEQANTEFEAATKDDDPLIIVNKPSDFPNASAMMNHEMLEDYHELGDDWLKRALDGLKKKIEETGEYPDGTPSRNFDQSTVIPASDRIVTLSDNAQNELEIASTAVIDAVTDVNGIDGDPTLRKIILGQLKAGRELIRSQIFHAQMLHLLMMDALKRLVDKYKGHVIGATAATLIELLIKNLSE
jgi:hypothetical protein